MVPSGINLPPGKFGKNNNRTPWNSHTLLKTQNMGCYLKEHFEVENPSEATCVRIIGIYVLSYLCEILLPQEISKTYNNIQ